MVLKVYCWPPSSNSRRIALILHEKKVPFEIVPVNLTEAQHKSPDYLKLHPFGQVPCIVEDDGFTLYEVRAIARYICDKYSNQGTPLLPDPADLRARALVEQAISVEMTHFEPPAQNAFFEGILKKASGGIPDEAVIAEHLAKLKTKLDVYEQILGEQKYLAGNTMTLADIIHLPYGTWANSFPGQIMESVERPNVARWWKELTQRPSWIAVKDSATSFAAYD